MNPFFKSFGFAFQGIKLGLKERNMKVHALCAVLCLVAGFIFDITLTEWCIILICIGVVFSLEMLNTAIEYLVDLAEPNYNPKAGAIKDIAAGAVLIFSSIAAIIGIMIFGNYILDLLLVN